MLTTELKNKLIERIRETNDEEILEEISHLLELQEPDTVYQTNENQKANIEKARQQIKNGQYLSDEDAEKDIDKWLNK